MEQLVDKNTEENEPALKERLKSFFIKTFHGEPNPCKGNLIHPMIIKVLRDVCWWKFLVTFLTTLC